jgi:maltooligosyltrehalose trehalohydrolase
VFTSRYTFRHSEGVSRPLRDHVLYEVHVGTFTEAGTYAGVRSRLDDLRALGITAIELMPIAAFDGRRGWGYDSVALYAPFAPYGDPDDLRALVDEAHGQGIAMILDVVYNHLGPAGNYLSAFSPEYFSAQVRNAWGEVPNFAHPIVRKKVLDNARYWLTEFRFDGLRLDATHAMIDPSARHILRELADEIGKLSPKKLLIAEDERNDPDLVSTVGLDAVWADDFHHQVRVTLTGEHEGYYAAYQPGVEGIAEAIRGGWIYRGQIYPPSGQPRGKDARALPADALVYCLQNHDQVGNRALGDRLHHTVSMEAYCAVSVLLLFLPATPLLFMGQEWAASSPFQFFTDHHAELGSLISQGRREEFKGFSAFSDPERRAGIPDPQDIETFFRSHLRWSERESDPHARSLDLYRRLIDFRRHDSVLPFAGRDALEVKTVANALSVRRWFSDAERILLVNLGTTAVDPATLVSDADHRPVLLSSDADLSLGPLLAPERAVVLGDRR